MVELNGVRIWAVTVEAGGTSPARKLVCGTLARPLDDLASRPALASRLAVPGRSDLSVVWNGWFELINGEVVGVYGAKVEPVG